MPLKIFTIELQEISNYKFLRNDARFFVGAKERKINNGIRLERIFETGRGRVINQEYVQENEGEYPLYSSQTQDDGIFGFIDTYDFDGEYLTWTTDGANAGRVFYRNGKFNCTNVCGTAKIKQNSKCDVNLNFLPYYLNTVTKYYTSVASGNPKLMNNVFEQIKIPLIPLETQNQIVAQIKPIEDKIASLKATIIPAQEIINRVFAREFEFDENLHHEFGKGMTASTQEADDKIMKIFTIPSYELARSSIVRNSTRFHNPPTKKLMDVLESMDTLYVYDVIASYEKGIQPVYDTEGDIPVVKIGSLKNGYIDFSEPELVSQKFFDELDDKKKLKMGDIIICATGKGSLGKIDYYDYEQEAITSVDNYIIRVDESEYNSLFFVYYFRSILGYFQIERDYTGATNQIHLYRDQISQFKIPNIPLTKQLHIVNEITAELNSQTSITDAIAEERVKIDHIIEQAIKN